jgi:hypothetical protein
VCNTGTFGDPFDAELGCSGCPQNSYCTSISQTACPAGYFALPASTLSTDCKCQPNANFVAVLGCTCLDGFKKTDVPLADKQLGNRTCTVCPPNYFCRLDATTACPDNSLASAGSVLVTDCKCNDGYYWDSATNSCPSCPAGFYCKKNAKSPCPDNTNSPALSSLQTHCACNAGFKCKRVRDVTVAIKFQLTSAEFTLAKQAEIKAKIATVAGVSESAVTLTASVSAPSRRLLALGVADPHTIVLDISAHIAGGTDLAPLTV